MRVFAIPDIHGRSDRLKNLLNHLITSANLDLTQDLLVFMGDYVDRGSNSKEVLDILIDLQKKGAIILLGNHERMFIDMIDIRTEHAINMSLGNGGWQTLLSYASFGTDEKISNEKILKLLFNDEVKKHVEWLKTLPFFYETDEFFFSHAPIPSYLTHYSLAKMSETILTWTFMKFGETEEQLGKRIEDKKIGVCGHIHALMQGITEPRFYEHYYFLDAGCGCDENAPLIACELNTKTVFFDNGMIKQY